MGELCAERRIWRDTPLYYPVVEYSLYSKRLPWVPGQNEFTSHIAEKRAQGRPLLDLTNSNPTIFDDYPHAEIARTYGEIGDFIYEPDAFGALSARAAIAEYYLQRGFHVAPERIVLTASTSEAYALLFKLLCDPSDEILVPIPSYPLFEYLAAVECVRAIPYRLLYDGSWYIDFEQLRAALTDRTRALVLVNPNNPTGSPVSKAETLQLLEISQERAMPLIVDEVFLDYPLEDGRPALGSFVQFDQTLTFSLSGLSKAAGMPQMKLGWIVVNGPAAQRQSALRRLELLADTFLSVGTPVQRALPALLKTGAEIRTSIQRRIRENYRSARDLLGGSAARVPASEAGWSAIVEFPAVMTDEEWVRRLLDEGGCIVQPGYFFDLNASCCAVVSLLTDRETFLSGSNRLRDLVARHA